jgi:hypothetical protein
MIMLRHGWPNSFDREGCRDAMLSWDQKKSLQLLNSLNNRELDQNM